MHDYGGYDNYQNQKWMFQGHLRADKGLRLQGWKIQAGRNPPQRQTKCSTSKEWIVFCRWKLCNCTLLLHQIASNCMAGGNRGPWWIFWWAQRVQRETIQPRKSWTTYRQQKVHQSVDRLLINMWVIKRQGWIWSCGDRWGPCGRCCRGIFRYSWQVTI